MEKIGIENQERKFSSRRGVKVSSSEVARREEEIEKKGELADTSRIVSEKISEYKNGSGESPCRRIPLETERSRGDNS